MKLLMIATALLVLSGCERAAEVEQLSEQRKQEQQVIKPAEFTVNRIVTDIGDVILVTDRVTGCQYISHNYHAAVTPRMNANGTHYCRKGQVTP